TQIENAFAAEAHWRDVPLVTGGGGRNPELAGGGVDDHRGGIANARVGDTGDERLRLRRTDADGLRVVPPALIPDVDVGGARCQRPPSLQRRAYVLGARALLGGLGGHGDVLVAGDVIRESQKSRGSVEVARAVGEEGVGAARRVVVAAGVEAERLGAEGCV